MEIILLVWMSAEYLGDNSSCADLLGFPMEINSSCTDCAGVINGASEDLGCGCGQPVFCWNCDGTEYPELGDQYAGGIVFRINSDGTGLVADLQDLVFKTVYNEVNWYTAMSAAENATSQGMVIGIYHQEMNYWK